MNNVLGIISEYNPFHNGHLLHLQESKRISNANLSIAVMSGNFVQRGDTSLVDKWAKAEMALKSGIDLVIELPTLYAISSAENFAEGAIKILNSLGIVTHVSFGSEMGEISPLNDVAEILYKEPKEFSSLISKQMHSGLSYPRARELAMQMYFGGSKKYTEALQNPNNILGVEYLKALKKYKSNIVPITLKRKYSDYNSTDVKSGIASATAIRTMIKQNKNIHYVVPFETYEIIENKKNEGQLITDLSHFSKEIIYSFRKMTLSEIANLPDVSEGLENKIKVAANTTNNFDTFLANIKSKRYTQSRIQRILLYSLLDISKKEIEMSRKQVPYIRVLGFNSKGKKMLSYISNNNPKLPIIVSLKRFMESNLDKHLHTIISKDIFATNVYTLSYKTGSIANLDYTHKIVEF